MCTLVTQPPLPESQRLGIVSQRDRVESGKGLTEPGHRINSSQLVRRVQPAEIIAHVARAGREHLIGDRT